MKSVDVCALNELPGTRSLSHKPAAFIVNSDPNFKPGTHWMAIFLPVNKLGKNNDLGEFFDPYGLPPSAYGKEIVQFLKAASHVQYAFNRLQVQTESSTLCGLYSCYYILKRLEGKSMGDIITYLYSIDEAKLITHFMHGLCYLYK